RPQARRALAHLAAHDGIPHRRGRGPGPIGVGEDVEVVQGGALDEPTGLLELLVGLAREADDHVRPETDRGRRLAEGLEDAPVGTERLRPRTFGMMQYEQARSHPSWIFKSALVLSPKWSAAPSPAASMQAISPSGSARAAIASRISGRRWRSE